MPGKKINRKGPAGNPGLTGTANQDQSPDQAMSTDSSSVAAGTPPQQGVPLDDGEAIIKAFNDLYEQSPDETGKEDDTSGGQNKEEDPGEEEGREEDDEFLLPESQGFVPGTAEDFAEKMRFNGLRWRHELMKRVKNDPKLRELKMRGSFLPSRQNSSQTWNSQTQC